MNGHKFKVGDRVRHDSGPEGIIVEVFPEHSTVALDSGKSTVISHFRLELVNSELEHLEHLEHLVRIANEGQEARALLATRYYNEVEFGDCLHVGDTWQGASGAVLSRTMRIHKLKIKPKAPMFPRFYVNDGKWAVALDNNVLHVGGQMFNAKAVKQALHFFEIGFTNSGPFYACKHGVYEKGCPTNVLNWADCDLILAALTKARV